MTRRNVTLPCDMCFPNDLPAYRIDTLCPKHLDEYWASYHVTVDDGKKEDKDTVMSDYIEVKGRTYFNSKYINLLGDDVTRYRKQAERAEKDLVVLRDQVAKVGQAMRELTEALRLAHDTIEIILRTCP